jgi:hypothetical protein
MHLIPRRLPPSMIVAMLALFVALAGTATAAVIISSPDQLASNVITSPKIVDGAVAQSDERNPSLRAKIDRNGKVIAGDVPGGVVEHTKRGQYNVTMSLGDVGPLGLDTCGVSVNPWLDFPENRHLKAYANLSPGSAQVNVFMFEEGVENGKHVEKLVDAAFDLVLAC